MSKTRRTHPEVKGNAKTLISSGDLKKERSEARGQLRKKAVILEFVKRAALQ